MRLCVCVRVCVHICRLAAQLARTEEAAKRALVQTDVTAKGGAAQKLLDAERALFKMRDENVELRGKLSRCVMGVLMSIGGTYAYEHRRHICL